MHVYVSVSLKNLKDLIIVAIIHTHAHTRTYIFP